MDIIKNKIRTIPNFPKPGIQFRDITTLLSDPSAFKLVLDSFTEHFKEKDIDYIAAVESRGFLIGAPLSLRLERGFVPIRKSGKLPGLTHKVKYNLEYGSDSLELHKDSFDTGSKILIVDDLLATGGTVEASTKLIEKARGIIVGYAFIIELVDLNGRRNLDNPIFSLVTFEGE